MSDDVHVRRYTYPFERTKRSRLNHFELFGFVLKKLCGALSCAFLYATRSTHRSCLPSEEDVCNGCHAHGSTYSARVSSAFAGRATSEEKRNLPG